MRYFGGKEESGIASMRMADSSQSSALAHDSHGMLALNWLALDVWPRLCVAHDLRLLWHNTAAERLLAAGVHLQVEGGFLAAVNPAHQADLDKLVHAPTPVAILRAFRCHENGDHFVIQAQGIGHHAGLPVKGLQVRPLRDDFGDRNFDHLRQLFKLTRAEYAVLLEMLRGNTADEISRHRASSVETVRTQIRQIYAKVGVSSRERLFRTVRPVLFL